MSRAPEKNVNVVLIGFMATGKTAVGRALAKKLKKKYVSTDTLVEKMSGTKISTIFKKKGEPYFRSLETSVLKSLKNKKKVVLSCGGGIVIKPVNRSLLRKLGTVIWLKASPEKINGRLGQLKQRPLLNIKGRSQRIKKIKEMLASRKPLYEKSANIAIDTDTLSIPRVVSKIASML